jgi:hypothetical protein
MEQTALNFNPKMSPQCQKLYDRLKVGPITNAQIRDDLRLLEYRRRFADMREKYGIQTEKKSLGHGIFEYSLKKDTSYEDTMDMASKYMEKYKNY